MSNREYHQAGSISLFTLGAVALAICGVALLFLPNPATSVDSKANDEVVMTVTTAAAGDVGYLPAQYTINAAEAQALPEQF